MGHIFNSKQYALIYHKILNVAKLYGTTEITEKAWQRFTKNQFLVDCKKIPSNSNNAFLALWFPCDYISISFLWNKKDNPQFTNI